MITIPPKVRLKQFETRLSIETSDLPLNLDLVVLTTLQEHFISMYCFYHRIKGIFVY